MNYLPTLNVNKISSCQLHGCNMQGAWNFPLLYWKY